MVAEKTMALEQEAFKYRRIQVCITVNFLSQMYFPYVALIV